MANYEILRKIAAQLRLENIKTIATAGSGHHGGTLSIIELLTILYFGKVTKYDPKDPAWPDRDRIILSKGHCAPALYTALAYAGFFPKEELITLRKFGSRLQGHTDLNFKTPGVETCGGPLGQGLSLALGMAIAAKLDNRKNRIYTIIGDGESAKGSITEAAKTAGVLKMDNMIAFLDYNKVDQDGFVKDVLPCNFEQEWQSYGWEVFTVNGNDVEHLQQCVLHAQRIQDDFHVPILIILDTIKGAGISFMENAAWQGDPTWHGTAPKAAHYESALKECQDHLTACEQSCPLSTEEYIQSVQITQGEKKAYSSEYVETILPPPPLNLYQEPTATRDAFGKYLTALGKIDTRIIAVSAGVSGSVKMDEFAKEFGTFTAENRSGRFIQVGIAEANMAGVAAGLALCGKKPWIATFDIFIKECLSVIRNAICYANVDVKIIGTHAGLGVEWDGGSHQSTIVPGIMADLFRMECYEPADAYETEEIMKLIYMHNAPAYMRLTRQKLPLYEKNALQYGQGARIIKNTSYPHVLILGSGAVLDNALQASLLLEKEGIQTSVIDVFSISHLNSEEFREIIPENILLCTVHDAHHKILAREVAYSLMQIGQTNTLISLGMKEFGESGSLQDLYKKHHLTPEQITNIIKENMKKM